MLRTELSGRDKIKYSCSGQNITERCPGSRDLFKLRAPVSICLYIISLYRFISISWLTFQRAEYSLVENISSFIVPGTCRGRVCKSIRGDPALRWSSAGWTFIILCNEQGLWSFNYPPEIAWFPSQHSQAWTARTLRSMEACMRLHKVWGGAEIGLTNWHLRWESVRYVMIVGANSVLCL